MQNLCSFYLTVCGIFHCVKNLVCFSNMWNLFLLDVSEKCLCFVNLKVQINTDKFHKSVARKLNNKIYFTLPRKYSTVSSKYSFFVLEISWIRISCGLPPVLTVAFSCFTSRRALYLSNLGHAALKYFVTDMRGSYRVQSRCNRRIS